jgi:hypothetical protein
LKLEEISRLTHRSMAEIIEALPDDVVRPALEYPGMKPFMDVEAIDDPTLQAAIKKRLT